jgi:uncharacterized protein (DUF4415 family)
MAKKQPASSQPERLIRKSAEDIWNKPLTEAEKETLRLHGARQAAGDDSRINFTDIPALTEEQLAGMIRFRDRRKVAVSIRLDPNILEWLKRKGDGHLTRINDILANVMEAEQKLH